MSGSKHATRRRAKVLRKDINGAEWLAWLQLRGRKIGGLKFRRQPPIGPYIADFACIGRKRVVEIDGVTHNYDAAVGYDMRRDADLASQGWRVLRVPNTDIHDDEDHTLGETIHTFLLETPDVPSHT